MKNIKSVLIIVASNSSNLALVIIDFDHFIFELSWPESINFYCIFYLSRYCPLKHNAIWRRSRDNDSKL